MNRRKSTFGLRPPLNRKSSLMSRRSSTMSTISKTTTFSFNTKNIRFGMKKKRKRELHPTEELNDEEFKKLCESSIERVKNNQFVEQIEYNELFSKIKTRNNKNQGRNTYSGSMKQTGVYQSG